jgi:hypothetical protein
MLNFGFSMTEPYGATANPHQHPKSRIPTLPDFQPILDSKSNIQHPASLTPPLP